MWSNSAPRFHNVIGPLLLPFFLLFASSHSSEPAVSEDYSTYRVHGLVFGRFPFDSPYLLVSHGPVSNGLLHTFGRFNGYSLDSFNYDPNPGFVGTDSFTYRACDSNGNCLDGVITLNVENNAPHAVADTFTVHEQLQVGGPFALISNDSDLDNDPFGVTEVGSVSYTHLTLPTILRV